MNPKKWIIIFAIETVVLFIGISAIVIVVDPYFHYHKPIANMFYTLNNQRSQNNGIIKYFEYDSIITGTSMSENFKTSEFDKIFQAKSIKVCFSGGSYKEINDNIKEAFDSGHEIKYVLRCLDYGKLLVEKDDMRTDLGEYPTYLYDMNPFNDVKYFLNKEIICNICIPMMINAYFRKEGGGITPFDMYSNWNDDFAFGAVNVLGDRKEYVKTVDDAIFTESDCGIVKGTIKGNVTDLAEAHPETTFYCFFSPYSIAYWGELYENGEINRQIDAEKIAIEQMLEYNNIKLYSFNDQWNIITNLDNYKDSRHYGEWINTEILHMIHEEIGYLTKENYREYIEKERNFYSNYNYQFYDGKENEK